MSPRRRRGASRLRAVAASHGVEATWTDVWGEAHEVSDDSLRAVLEAMGVDVDAAPPDLPTPTAAPDSSPPARRPLPEPTWGLFAPLVPLWRRRGDRVAGGLRELEELGVLVADHGGGVVATLPLLAAPPGATSPYAPVSRVMWDERTIDVDRLVADVGGDAARAVLDGAPSDTASPLVDVAARERLVHAVLDAVLADAGDRVLDEVAAFAARRPLVDDFARWRSDQDDGGSPDRTRLGQWVADRQLGGIAERLRRRGVEVLLDLPVGTHPDGFDVSRSGGHYVVGASVGAPPDEFFTDGQDWGFPPLDPAHAASAMAEVVAHHAAVSGMLRIDHVMGIHRIWWVPRGRSPAEGAYVRYPADRTWRAMLDAAGDTTLVGEDLGTVPDDVREAMERYGALGMTELQFEAGSVPAELPARTLAGTGTHDMATWREFCVDRPDDADALAEGITAVLGGTAPDDADGRLDLALDYLGRSEAAVVVVNLDDLVGEDVAINVPGTSDDQRPENWRRRSTVPMEEIPPMVNARLDRLDAARPGGTAPEGTPGGPSRDGLVGADDRHLFNEGTHRYLHHVLGAHPDGDGCWFAVWAPNAQRVAVVGDWNAWDGSADEMATVEGSGIWQTWAAGATLGHRYKYRIVQADGTGKDKADPFATAAELPPRTASIVADPRHTWADDDWMAVRGERNDRRSPISIYEVHLGSWAGPLDGEDRLLTYRELAPALAEHCTNAGFTHVELLPVMEHPFTGSWGYQCTGFFAPTSRFGDPEDFMWFVDHLHQQGIGVILDWVPSHFPVDDVALASFDGTALYEHADPRQGFHPDWGSLIFNYGRHEVRSFLLSSAVSWLERYHIDALRVDAVASMLYLDYSRQEGEWIPNAYGGRENLEAIDFLRQLNDVVDEEFPGVTTFAEESTAWPGVSTPTHLGGLGFGYKWDMGWMHDTLAHLARDPVFRRFHHHELTFRGLYWQSENYCLPLSHDEVVHGKGSLINKMPGDDWQKAANLRLLLGYQWTAPGKKLLFMGSEFGQWREWNHDGVLDFWLFEQPLHEGIFRWLARCNELYRSVPALHDGDCLGFGFEWVHADDAENGVVSFLRRPEDGPPVLVVVHTTPTVLEHYRVGVPTAGHWRELASSDELVYGGSGVTNADGANAGPVPAHGREWSIELTLPPLGVVLLVPEG